MPVQKRRFRLTNRPHRYRARVRADRHAGDLDVLRGFHVRAKRDAVSREPLAHGAAVALDLRVVEEERGRADVRQGGHGEYTDLRRRATMLRHELLSDKRILVLQPDGPLQAADFERVAREIDPFIEKGGDLAGLMIEAAHPPGWDNFASFATHLRFVRDHHRRVRRIAVVTDSSLLSAAPKLAGHFVSAEVKTFPAGGGEARPAWLESGAKPA